MTNEDNAPQVYLLGKTFLPENSRNQFYIRNDPIVQIACGDQHTIIVTESGRAFAFGDNNFGQLGLGHNDRVDKVSCIKSLKFSEDGDKVSLVACGRDHSVVATTKGSIYGFGSNNVHQLGIDNDKHTGQSTESSSSMYSKPIKLDHLLPHLAWKQLAAGSEHTCALTQQGTIYVWGSNSEGQCGLARQQETIEFPQELKLPYRVKAIACGYYHTALVSDDGKLYTFGSNGDQQLGRFSSEKQVGPIHVSLTYPVKSVACGHQHTAVLTDNGRMLVVGNGDRGQLGLGPSLLLTEHFEPVDAFEGKKVTAIACGEGHTVAIVGKGDLYVFGDGRHGKLGVNDGKLTNEFQPRFVEKFHHFTVLKVSCGGCHTILLAQQNSKDNKNKSDSDDDIKGKTLSGTQMEKSLARVNRLKSNQKKTDVGNDTLTDSTRTHVKPLASTLKPTTSSQSNRAVSPDFPRHNSALRTEPTSDDGNETNEELSASIQSATFNQTHTFVKGKFKPKESLTHDRTLGASEDLIRTGALDRTVKIQKVPSDNDSASDSDLRKPTLPAINTQSWNNKTNSNNNNSRLMPINQNSNKPLSDRDQRDLKSNAKSYDNDDENKSREHSPTKLNRFDEPLIKNSRSTPSTFSNERKSLLDNSKHMTPYRDINNDRDSSPKGTYSPDTLKRTTTRKSPIKDEEEDDDSSDTEKFPQKTNNASLRKNETTKTPARIPSNIQAHKRSPDMRNSRKFDTKRSDDSEDEFSSSNTKPLTSTINQRPLKPTTTTKLAPQSTPLARKANMMREPQRRLSNNDDDDSDGDNSNREDRKEINNRLPERRGSLPTASRNAPTTSSFHRDGSQTISGRPLPTDLSRSGSKRIPQTPATGTLATRPTKANQPTSETPTEQPGFFSRLFRRSGSATITKTPPESSAKPNATTTPVKSNTTTTPANSNTSSKTCVIM